MKITARKLRLMALGTLTLLALMQWAWGGSTADRDAQGAKRTQQPAPAMAWHREAPNIAPSVPLSDFAGAYGGPPRR